MVWNAQEVGKVGAILEITLIPTVDVELIPDSTLYKFAQLMRHVNSLYGTPVLLRFMHEMNGMPFYEPFKVRSRTANYRKKGNWLIHYGMRPIEFKQAFITMTSYVRQLTNMTGMIRHFQKIKSFFNHLINIIMEKL